MYKIGMIGDRDSVIGFMALGFSVFEAKDSQEAGKILHRLVKSEEYAVIYLVEDYAEKMESELDKYKDLPLPAITTMPGIHGSTGYGISNLRHAVERAVGADILFNNNN
ncbi:MAG: V-type ATP synthase subunit F [Clostridia bacterium]|nr:V-type ATP synthase subunit F [Clostridia bacterium]